jgi:hypothetical protein
VELQQRLKGAKGKHRKEIEEEIRYQRRMLSCLSFMAERERTLPNLWKRFNEMFSRAIQALKEQKIQETVNYLQHAKPELQKILKLHKKQKHLERYLAKLDHRLIKDLKKERKGK